MANIDYLVKDMYSVLSKGVDISDEQADLFGKRMAELIRHRLSTDKERGPGLRMSSFGTSCDKALWYKSNKPELAEPLEPWVLFKFLYGDVIEELTLFIAELTEHKVEGRQTELDVQGIKGHRDAVIDGITVDVKSANSRGMHKFKNHALERDDPFGYMDQISLYAYAGKNDPLVKEPKSVAFLAVDKELGHLVLDKYQARPTNYDMAMERKKRIVASPVPPAKGFSDEPDGASGNRKLGLTCSYCSFKAECWKDSNEGKGLRTFIYSTGPRYLTKVVKQPDVLEKT